MDGRLARRGLIAIALLGLAACSSMGPQVLPEETALPRAETRYWHEIAAVHPDDWYHVLNSGEEAL
ncbi:MAG: hypothetical protein OEM03_12170, partial [Chromatiales bacterium]|nr:hypothetical protein [Chromatiales bacterium]